MAAIPTRCGWVFDHSRGPFWLRLGRAALYRRMPSCRTTPWPGRRNTAKALPICNRRYGRLYDCAIISRHAGYRIQTDPSPHPSPLGGERVPVGRVRGILHVPKFLRGYVFGIAAAVDDDRGVILQAGLQEVELRGRIVCLPEA